MGDLKCLDTERLVHVTQTGSRGVSKWDKGLQSQYAALSAMYYIAPKTVDLSKGLDGFT